MPKLNFEIMIFNNDKNASDTKLSMHILQEWFSNTQIFFIKSEKESAVKFKSNDGEIDFDFKVIEHESDTGVFSYILNFKSLTNIYKKKIFLYDQFLVELKKTLSINHCLSYHLNRELSRYYSEELYTNFNNFEIGLRRLMHLIFFKKIGIKWETKLFPSDIISKLESKFSNTGSDHIIEELELSYIENLLFKESFIECIDNDKGTRNFHMMNIIGNSEKQEYFVSTDFILKNSGSFRTFSLWNEYFSKLVHTEFQGSNFESQFKKARELRNQVAHNKKVTYQKYNDTKQFLKSFTKEIHNLSVIYEKENTPAFPESLTLAIQDSVKSIIGNFNNNQVIINAQEIAKSLSSFADSNDFQETFKTINNIANNPAFQNNMKNFQKLSNHGLLSNNEEITLD